MTRVEAPGYRPAVAGGEKDKARIGAAPEKATNTGHGGSCFAPVAQMQRAPGSYPEGAGWIPAGGNFFSWVQGCVNTPEPATAARMRGSDCTGKGNGIIASPRALVKEPAVNTLKLEKKIQVLNALIEGNSIRSTERMTGVHRDTITRVVVEVGNKCQQMLDEKLVDLKVDEVECDEIWCYVRKKQKRVTPLDNAREVGDQYVFVAMDANTKLVASHLIGKRTGENALELMRDLQWRVNCRFQLTTDGYRPYLEAVERTFGRNIDFAQLVKLYGGDEKTRERYSPSEIVEAIPVPVTGNPKPDKISTSYVERQNLTMRMQMRRFTRLTNAFSKKLANLKAAVALHFAHYNFMRVHRTLRVTPAMQAGIADHIWTWDEILNAA